MATTTPNYSWPVPTSTDLVKDGATAIEALGDAIDTTVFGLGVSGAWVSYTPTFSGGTWAVGNGTFTDTKYKQLGKTVIVKGVFTFGSTTAKAAATALTMSLPVTPIASTDAAPGNMQFLDSGTANVLGTVSVQPTNMVPGALAVSGTSVNYGGVTATSPFTWATNDQIRWTLIYEAA